MTNVLAEKVKVCIAIEATTAEIYHLLSARFPGTKAFWRELALSEENHTNILVVGAGYLKTGELPECVVPASQELIDETFRLVRNAKSEIMEKQLSLADALTLVLKIENSIAENYFQEVMRSETDSPVIEKLQKIRKDELTHVEKIEEFMKRAGVGTGGIN
ncbi:MAG: hypothetical protein P8013_02065 [Candidatus Sulfobium sp.]|jgi:Asp-tRNA(Asn)/Glu-tRNA(Gln) amidotransferase C subunit